MTVGADKGGREDTHGFLQSILAAVPMFITRIDRDDRITYINLEQRDIDPGDVIGRGVFEFIAPEFHDTARRCFKQVLEGAECGQYESVAAGPNGPTAYYVNYVTAIRQGDEISGLCIVGHDVTEQRARERRLRESQDKLRFAAEATGMGTWELDFVTGHTTWDARMCEIFGRDEACSLDVFMAEYVHPDDRDIVAANNARMLETGSFEISTMRFLRDGEVRWAATGGLVRYDERGEPMLATGGMIDVTAQHLAAERLGQVRKMEAVGQLTAGIAHNFNNMLMALIPALDLLDDEVQTPAARHVLDDARDVAARAAELVAGLMSFAGQRPADSIEPVDVRAIVAAAVAICRRTFDRTVAITVEANEELVVLADAGEVTQVLVNLLINARDVMMNAATPKPSVVVRIERAAAGKGSPAVYPPNDDFVKIGVVDNGPGMTPAARDRVFEPFFTTTGNGLGLATCYAVARRHGGWMECHSTPGAGSEFALFLRATQRAPSRQASSTPASALPQHVRILVIDDEPPIRRIVGRVLQRAGIGATIVGSVEEARAVLATDVDYHLTLLDRSMPHGRGAELVPELRRALPGAPILFFTGEQVEDDELELVDGVLYKPVNPKQLLAAIRAGLAGSESR